MENNMYLCMMEISTLQKENVYFPRETIILIIGPEFDKTVWASFNDIFEKSTPSMSSTLSIGFSFPCADDCAFTSLINIPCWHGNVKEKCVKICWQIWLLLYVPDLNV